MGAGTSAFGRDEDEPFVDRDRAQPRVLEMAEERLRAAVPLFAGAS